MPINTPEYSLHFSNFDAFFHTLNFFVTRVQKYLTFIFRNIIIRYVYTVFSNGIILINHKYSSKGMTFQMEKITVNASTPYEVLIGQGLLMSCGKLAREVTKSNKMILITDDIVDNLYSETVIHSLTKEGFNVFKYVFPNGEKSKSMDNLINIYNFLAEHNVSRTDCLCALGGGVTGDITGYAAATYLRGIDFIQIPTTLLAQIDSSVGGKTAVNLPCGKNLIGAFKQPKLVICDPLTLKTLSESIVSDGMAEAIKYGMIKSHHLFDIIASHNSTNYFNVIDDIVSRCITIKSMIVEKDEFDKGERMLLNFGHTMGHAVESFYHYEKYTHGSAVAIGMNMITEQAVKAGICSSEALEELKNVLLSYSLPLNCDAKTEELLPLCCNDKKCESSSINAIVCSQIGKSEIRKMPFPDFEAFMKA